MKFGNLYIKPSHVFVDEYGHVKLQFEADSNSALGYLYDNLCKELGITWNYNSPSNNYGLYTNCAMHSAGDRASYGCGPDGSGVGGFCPQMTIAYSVKFKSDDYAATYLEKCNDYVDYWRSLYPTGVAVGTTSFCPDGGCLGLYLNRYDLYSVFKPDLGGSWVEYNGASMAPTLSPAPTAKGGCSEKANFSLDKCYQQRTKRLSTTSIAWNSLGRVGQASVILVSFMASTLAFSLFISRARKKRRRGESYLGFFLRDTFRLKKKKRKGKKSSRKKRKSLYRKLKGLDKDLEQSMLDDKSRRSRSSRSRSRGGSRSKSGRSSTSGSKSRSKSRSGGKLSNQTVTPSSSSRRSSKSRSKSRSRREIV